jgi:hypothetical protein
LGGDRCADVARALGTNPSGTAGFYDGFFLLPAAPPWPRDAMALLPDGSTLGRVGEQWRVQLLAGVGAAGAPVVYRRPAGPFSGYATDTPRRDVLLCCHGRRDVCCGAAGTRLFQEVAGAAGLSADLWRTSHLGGHRFAPTALILPEGTMWAYLDASLLTGIINRSIPVSQVVAHYRGCTGLSIPAAQVADGAALERFGWSWLDEPRTVTVRSEKGNAVEVDLESALGLCQAVIRAARSVPIPDCGVTLGPSTPLVTEYEVAEFTTFDSASGRKAEADA